MDIKNINLNNNPLIMDSFGKMFVCNDSATDDKSIIFPNGYNQDLNISFKVLFTNGHFKNNDSSNMTLNNIPVVVNKYGTLIPIPNHDINNTGLVYNTLQSNTILDMYYTNNYDGNDNPAFVVIGNPVVMSSVDYTIYADGKIGNDEVGTVKAWSLWNVPYGWLECNGQAIPRTTYKELYDKFRTQYVNGSSGTTLLTRYGIGDGNNTFQLPDYEETALVGIGTNIKDANTIGAGYHDRYTLGQFKNDQFQNHRHDYYMYNHEVGNDTTGGSFEYGYDANDTRQTSYVNLDSGIRVGDVTRGKRKGVKYIIKALY